ncbi:MAG: response regulator [Thermoproteota archaeon]|nr:response regulator [Thermoproteota archaeon]
MDIIYTKVAAGITAVAIVLFEIIPMSTILIVSMIMLQQQEKHIIYPIMITTTKAEDEHIIATPSYGLFLLSDSKSTNFKKDQYQEANGKHLPSLTNKSRTNTKRILIVDDEPDITFCFKMTLEDNGFKEQVDAYNDPRMALSAFSPGSYALLLLDIGMPSINGLALYEKIRKIDSKIRVLFITAFDFDYEVLRKLYPQYVDVIATLIENSEGCFIKKPTDTDDMVRRVKKEVFNYSR